VLFYSAYNNLITYYGEIFPLGWDPPHYAGYANVILQGNYMRPLLEAGDVRILYYFIATISLITGLNSAIATIVTIHALLIILSALSTIAIYFITKNKLISISAPILLSFMNITLRFYTLPSQLLAVALELASFIVVVNAAETKRIKFTNFVLSLSLLFWFNFLSHWYYTFLVVVVAFIIHLRLFSREYSSPVIKRGLLLSIIISFIMTLPFLKYSISKVEVWKLNILLAQKYEPFILQPIFRELMWNQSLILMLLWFAGLASLIIPKKLVISDKSNLFCRTLYSCFVLAGFLVLVAGILFQNSAYEERSFFVGLDFLLPFIGLSFIYDVLSSKIKKVKIKLIIFNNSKTILASSLLICLLIIISISSAIPSVLKYRSTYVIPYIDPNDFITMKSWNISIYEKPVIIINNLPYPPRMINYIYYGMMLHGDIYFWYGSLESYFKMVPDLNISNLDGKSMNTYTYFVLLKNGFNANSTLLHKICLSKSLSKGTIISEKFYYLVNASIKHLYVDILPRGAVLDYSLDYVNSSFEGTYLTIHVLKKCNATALSLNLIFSEPQPINQSTLFILRFHRDSSLTPSFMYFKVNIEQWHNYLYAEVPTSFRDITIKLLPQDFIQVGTFIKNATAPSVEICFDPQPGIYEISISLAKLNDLIVVLP
jgi:hypothetical protein